jgi:hypothetical protein
MNMGTIHEASNGNVDFIWNWTRDHLCYFVAKNLSTFCPGPDTLCEAEFNGDGFTSLVGKKFKASQYLGCGMGIAGCF